MIIDENQLSWDYHVVDMKLCRILHKVVCLYVQHKAYQILCCYWITYEFLCGNILFCIFEYFSFVTKGKYFNYILNRQKYLKYVLLLAVDTWPMSLTPTIGDSGGSWKNENPSEEKNPVEPLPACKNLVSQVKNFAGL